MKKLFIIVALLFSTQANAFLVSSLAGERVNVRDYIGDGRWTVVMLWQLACVPCEEQKPSVEAFHNKYNASSGHVVGLVIDGHEYMPEIQAFVAEKPTAFPSHVVFGDVFRDQITEETGKSFNTAPGYLVYAPDGELKLAINNRVNIDELLGYIVDQFSD